MRKSIFWNVAGCIEVSPTTIVGVINGDYIHWVIDVSVVVRSAVAGSAVACSAVACSAVAYKNSTDHIHQMSAVVI